MTRMAARGSHALTALGERLDFEPLIYHPGVMLRYDWLARANAPGLGARLVEAIGPVSYLDVGAGTGRFTEALRKLGATADACEHSSWGRKLAALRGLTLQPFDLTREPAGPSPDQYEAAFSLEVAEHLPPELGDRLVAYLAAAPVVVFTAARPGQGGTGHINLQPKGYWAERFAQHGHTRDTELEQRILDARGLIHGNWLLENLTVFRR